MFKLFTSKTEPAKVTRAVKRRLKNPTYVSYPEPLQSDSSQQVNVVSSGVLLLSLQIGFSLKKSPFALYVQPIGGSQSLFSTTVLTLKAWFLNVIVRAAVTF